MNSKSIRRMADRIAEDVMESSELQDEYQDYFEEKMDEHGIDSPAEADDAKKKEFFDDVDEGWVEGKGRKEK
jgi:hypothetical protein